MKKKTVLILAAVVVLVGLLVGIIIAGWGWRDAKPGEAPYCINCCRLNGPGQTWEEPCKYLRQADCIKNSKCMWTEEPGSAFPRGKGDPNAGIASGLNGRIWGMPK